MSGPSADGGGVFPMKLLLFSAAGFDFGAEADQVAAMAPWDGTDQDDLFRLENAPCQAGRRTESEATVITVRAGTGFRALVEDVEDIVEVSAHDLRPFPKLIEPLALKRGMWGVYPRNGRLFLLVDFERMNGQSCLWRARTLNEDTGYETELA